MKKITEINPKIKIIFYCTELNEMLMVYEVRHIICFIKKELEKYSFRLLELLKNT